VTHEQPWWQSATIYQIYPRSFCDSTGNGVGDLGGVIAHLDHLAWLGVNTLWLSPIFVSPMADHGYDVADYCDIDPLFGDLAQFDALVVAAHELGVRVVLDWVPNHSSDQHPWFVESRSARDSPKRDWYVWRDGDPATPPNNWTAAFGSGPAWTWDDETSAWFLHLFTPDQPDLDWSHAPVRDAMLDTLRFWLDRGVDGFRMDVVHLIAKPDGLPDRADGEGSPILEIDEPRVHDHLRDIRGVLDGYDHRPMSVGEVYLLDPAQVATYYGDGDELHLSFNFSALHSPWDAAAWRNQIVAAQSAFDPSAAWPTWVLSNHDQTRHRQRYGGSEAIARAAAVLLLTLRGTPFLYAGEEFGLEDADVPLAMRQDPAGRRDGCRAPIPWTAGAGHGWTRPDNWLPFPPEADRRNAESMRADPSSIAHLYRQMLQLRRESAALSGGSMTLLDGPESLVVWERRDGEECFVIAVNMATEAVELDLDGSWTVAVDSTVGAGAHGVFDGVVAANAALVLAPSTK
jgi:alpha-glucosidase